MGKASMPENQGGGEHLVTVPGLFCKLFYTLKPDSPWASCGYFRDSR